jgi:predicted nucleic acid-binding protein
MIVVDSSVMVDVLLGTLDTEPITNVDLAAPHLLDAEVANAFRRQAIRDLSLARKTSAALSLLADLTITRYGHADLIARAWHLRNNLTIYDGLYVALAESLGVPLVTRDQRIARCPGLTATIEVI